MDTAVPQLSARQLIDLLLSVFGPREGEGDLTLLTDLPSNEHGDNPLWSDRRRMCGEWYSMLLKEWKNPPFRGIQMYAYPNVGSNNNDLPATVCPVDENCISRGAVVPLEAVLAHSAAVLSVTEFSATAPLKLLGKRLGFRGATMPGFSRSMIPALGLDYEEINAKVVELKERMDRMKAISITLETPGGSHQVIFDTRFRQGHASGGLMRESGQVGNLPSGEAYIVPYEGEKEGVPSRSEGTLPVQFGSEIVLYEIKQNKAVRITSSGIKSREEAELLASEPAYGNIAEIGIGVLGSWGVHACGSTLLDEKLGLHIAFGRSDHFGGVTSPSSFTDPRRVVHIDRVYVPSVQSDIRVREVVFHFDESEEKIIVDDQLLV